MRTTIVPAQITTVEDKIAGNLNLTQVFLLLTPIFFGSIIYLIFPPQLHFALYKLPIILVIAAVAGILAIRIKGKVIVQWLVILIRYNNRPSFYNANKNDAFNRTITEEFVEHNQVIDKIPAVKKAKKKYDSAISLLDKLKLEQLLTKPESNTKFTFAKKGRLYVTLSQVKN